MCFAPQRRALFRHLNCQKWSELGVFCAFSLRNVLRATTACNFSSLIWPTSSAPAALASLLVDPPEPQIIGKTQCFATLSFRKRFAALARGSAGNRRNPRQPPWPHQTGTPRLRRDPGRGDPGSLPAQAGTHLSRVFLLAPLPPNYRRSRSTRSLGRGSRRLPPSLGARPRPHCASTPPRPPIRRSAPWPRLSSSSRPQPRPASMGSPRRSPRPWLTSGGMNAHWIVASRGERCGCIWPSPKVHWRVRRSVGYVAGKKNNEKIRYFFKLLDIYKNKKIRPYFIFKNLLISRFFRYLII